MIGEHIRARKDGRWNHAIDCGDETVIHLASGEAPRVVRSYRPEFVSGADVVEVVTHRERTFPSSEIVARAYSRIADAALASMFADSEAFAQWCAIGRTPAAGPRNVALSVPGARSGAGRPAARSAPAKARNGRQRKAAPRKARPKRRAKPARGASARAARRPARSAKRARKAPRARRRR